MNRQPQTFSRTVNGKTQRFYDPLTRDNRNRPKSDFNDARPYRDGIKVAVMELTAVVFFIATMVMLMALGGMQ